MVTDLAPEGRGIPWDKMDPSEEAVESIAAEVGTIFSLTLFKGIICEDTISIWNIT